MKRRLFVLTAIGATLLGSGLHFLYEALPNPLTALISPVNESVWEHLKLLYFPMLLGAFLLSRFTKEKYRLWSGFFLAILCMPPVLTGLYYLLKGGFGVESLVVDIALYALTMLGGFAFAYRLFRCPVEKWTGILLMLVILYGASLLLFTFCAPNLPIFLSPQ